MLQEKEKVDCFFHYFIFVCKEFILEKQDRRILLPYKETLYNNPK